MDEVTIVYVLWVVLVILSVIGGWRHRRRLQQLERWATQHAPLSGAAASITRLDGALRDAEEGFRICGVCAFENLRRRQFCLLCGTITTTDRTSITLLSEEQLTKRQRRARMRKEWQRRLDERGHLRWERQEGLRSHSNEFRAVKLEFDVVLPLMEAKEDDVITMDLSTRSVKGDPAEQPQDEPSPSVRQHLDSSARDDFPVIATTLPRKPRLELKNLDVVDTEIHAQLANCTRSVREATSVDPSELGIRFIRVRDATTHIVSSNSVERIAELKAFLHDASLPFPSRLVEFIARATNVQQPGAVTEAETSAPPDASSRIQLRVDRDCVLVDSIQMLARLPSEIVRLGFRIAFQGETAVDAGGVYREWLLVLNEALLAPDAGIFTCVNAQDPVFYLNPHSKELLGEQHLTHFLAVGRLLGRALLEGNVTGFHLALPLLKIILGQPVSLHDLEYYDPDVYKNLQWLLVNDGVDTLGLDFTVVEKLPNGTTRLVKLVPQGHEIDLTDSNKHEYVHRKLQYLLFERVQDQLFAFLKGLYEVVPAEMLLLFDADELDYLLSGSDEIDVDDWEKHTRYTVNLLNQPVRQWFWEIVRDMPNEHRRRLLQFSTGASHVPLAGFAGLTSYDDHLSPFTLRGVTLRQTQYIRSHACFNELDLPLYESKQQLTAMLSTITATDTNAHGFTIV